MRLRITIMFTYLSAVEIKNCVTRKFLRLNSVFQYLFSGVLFKNNPPIGQQIVETSPQCAEKFERTICASYTRMNAAVVFTLLMLQLSQWGNIYCYAQHILQLKWNEMATCRFSKDGNIWGTCLYLLQPLFFCARDNMELSAKDFLVCPQSTWHLQRDICILPLNIR